MSNFGYWVTECRLIGNTKGVYILYKINMFNIVDMLYVGQGNAKSRLNNSHSKEDSINKSWTNGIVIECNNRILRQMLEKMLIHILKPKNNKIIPKIHHLILGELVATNNSAVYRIEQKYID